MIGTVVLVVVCLCAAVLLVGAWRSMMRGPDPVEWNIRRLIAQGKTEEDIVQYITILYDLPEDSVRAEVREAVRDTRESSV